jgi:long-chain acyl-CoA synthetase
MVPEKLPPLYFERFGCLPRIVYGLTEAPTGVAANTGETPYGQGAIGRPLAQFEIEILDDGGQAVAPGVSGEICLRAARTGPLAGIYQPTLGYWKNQTATDRLLRDGWLHTGDIGFKDEAGVLHIQDRRSDVIIRGGANIYPAEVERVLRMDHRVADCAVLGMADERLGQVAVAIVEPVLAARHDETLLPRLKDLCHDNLARYKQPAEWHVIEEMPRNIASKIIKPALKEWLAGARAARGT